MDLTTILPSRHADNIRLQLTVNDPIAKADKQPQRQ